ncbi:MAG: hypothetical protein SV186_06930 [Candidatus Nanohaloarchaea archaeon]|nr:hypothetical protein [Candidatus Nanohaloarchaea archaeon]
MDPYEFLPEPGLEKLVIVMLAVIGVVAILLVAPKVKVDVSSGDGPSVTVLETRTVNGTTIRMIKRTGENYPDDGIRYPQIVYNWSGRQYVGPFIREVKPALDWLRVNSPANATVAAWWDYGPAIRGYANRSVVAFTPSAWAYRYTVSDSSGGWNTSRGELANASKIRDLARLFVSNSSQEVVDTMQQYGVDYLILTAQDTAKYTAISMVAHNSTTPVTSIASYGCVSRNGSCVLAERNGTTYLKYNGRGIQINVPVVSLGQGVKVVGAPNVYTRSAKTHIKHYCTERGVRTFNVSDAAFQGCFAFRPGTHYRKLVYVPEGAMDAAFVRLFFMDEHGFERLEDVYTTRGLQVYELERQ